MPFKLPNLTRLELNLEVCCNLFMINESYSRIISVARNVMSILTVIPYINMSSLLTSLHTLLMVQVGRS